MNAVRHSAVRIHMKYVIYRSVVFKKFITSTVELQLSESIETEHQTYSDNCITMEKTKFLKKIPEKV